MSFLVINSIMNNPSLCDGIGYRTLLFLQGCDLHCQGCHNPSMWDITKGIKRDVRELATELQEKCFNKKLTITGGEPLYQKVPLLELLRELSDFDLCLYTGYNLADVPPEILHYLKYIKVGPYIGNLKTTTSPFIGSKNQKFIDIRGYNYGQAK